MKVLKQILFIIFATAIFSLSALAQRQDDNKNRPPKDPPQIVAPEKEKPRERPRNDNGNSNSNRPKKPDGEFSEIENVAVIGSI